jgi:Carboxypeptidase regulatory-like domain
MSWRLIGRFFTHRFVAAPLALAVLVVAWNVYIAFNDHGIIEGEVRDRAGAPVAGATVIFFERNFVYYEEKHRTSTDAQGLYRFTDMKIHIGQLEARTADGRQSERRQLRLWFRSQDTEVAPLVVEAPRG